MDSCARTVSFTHLIKVTKERGWNLLEIRKY
jgi:hypothetical protein